MFKEPHCKEGQWQYEYQSGICDCETVIIKAPFQVGEVRWVREMTRLLNCFLDSSAVAWWQYIYDADGTIANWIELPERMTFIPEIGNCVPNGCFKELARIFIKPTRVWAERVQDISTPDAHSEGVSEWKPKQEWIERLKEGPCYRNSFHLLWDSCYPGSWDRNDWVFACEFERCNRE